jgi:hypothetical protein
MSFTSVLSDFFLCYATPTIESTPTPRCSGFPFDPIQQRYNVVHTTHELQNYAFVAHTIKYAKSLSLAFRNY